MFNTLTMFLVLNLLPLAGFAEQEGILLGFEGLINSSSFERSAKEISFETSVPIPSFVEKGH